MRVPMIEMIVFSLKPALVSLTIAALLSACCCWLDCAWPNATSERTKTRETEQMIRAANEFMLSPHTFKAKLFLRNWPFVLFRRFAAVDSVTLADLFHIVTSFTIWGNVATVFHHRALARIITREDQIDPTAEHGHQLLQITG